MKDIANLLIIGGICGVIVDASPSFANLKPSEVPRKATLTGGFVDDRDYPKRYYSKGIGGTVVMRFYTGPAGRIYRCKIASSSGWPELDAFTCAIITARLRYDPARDEIGTKIWDTRTQSISWAPNGSRGSQMSKPAYFDYSYSVEGLPGTAPSVLVSLTVLTDETGKPKSLRTE
jgi:TonB family protein